MVNGDFLAKSAREFRDDFRHARGQGKFAAFDSAKNEYVGQRLGSGKQTEDRIFGQRAAVLGIAVADRFVNTDHAVASHQNYRAIIAAALHVLLHNRLQMPKAIFRQSGRIDFARHFRSLSNENSR